MKNDRRLFFIYRPGKCIKKSIKKPEGIVIALAGLHIGIMGKWTIRLGERFVFISTFRLE